MLKIFLKYIFRLIKISLKYILRLIRKHRTLIIQFIIIVSFTIWTGRIFKKSVAHLDNMEQINAVLALMSSILATISVGAGALAFVMVNKYKKLTSYIFLIVSILILLSVGSAVLSGANVSRELKIRQLNINWFCIVGFLSYLVGTSIGETNNEKRK